MKVKTGGSPLMVCISLCARLSWLKHIPNVTFAAEEQRSGSTVYRPQALKQKSAESQLTTALWACEMHVCKWLPNTSFMNAVQFVHCSDRKEPVASLGAHRQGPTKTHQSRHDHFSLPRECKLISHTWSRQEQRWLEEETPPQPCLPSASLTSWDSCLQQVTPL